MKTLLKFTGVVLSAAVLAGCTTMGTVGMITKSSADPMSVLQKGRSAKELGPAQAEACRYFLLGIAPWGKSDLQTAVDKALAKDSGDALVNVAVASSLYGFVPFYNVFSYTCTTVKGTAIKFQETASK